MEDRSLLTLKFDILASLPLSSFPHLPPLPSQVEEATEVLESVSLELCLKTAKASLALASCKLNLPFYADLVGAYV